ncbi:CRISPR type III-associated protein (TIGR04423 family) [Kordia periserrulae]|uniref:CRISPR type III-associated protein (TIGR04423 family) n=1 Tax=Kordia periserrulae TaxID=701523 RepID=A0A2T6BUS0_9FLAO|nr:TIGR04423 family type III CRISPR-associated protein [Kordia periserrulae]PTX59815.1 CRISPR type III-associated protein (TIGR04423 family) [Kordia periserrulae]
METTRTQQITTDELWDIFDAQYSWTGYLWQDDRDKPFVFINQLVNYREYFTTTIPFIVEGYLVNENQTISLTIKNIDGVYYCYKSEGFADLENEQKFPAHKAFENTGIKALEFIPVFKKQEDSLSPNFQEYVYSHQIFKGIVS